MPISEEGSLTKEPPLAKLDATIRLVTSEMPYEDLKALATENTHAIDPTHADAPGLVCKRFLLIKNKRIVYDRLLSLVEVYGLEAPLIRKVMYFTWAWRDERLRSFICNIIAGSDGRWNIANLTDITKSKFFLKWFSDSSAKKARSNIEFFLRETGIYRPNSQSVHLELDVTGLAKQ